ncbi:MAG: DUF2752 domain-containing protein [Thermoanaerobaculia bacterium]|nr:DUF2752 domain-containing protein [Thermoanaerobaculia bacterium]
MAVSIAILVGAGVLIATGRSSGVGLELCWLRRLTDLPCPGCGLTRAVCFLFRGHWMEAWKLHPFSYVFTPWAIVAVSTVLWPRSFRLRARLALDRHRRGFHQAYFAIIVAFVTFGFLRAVAVKLNFLVWS